MRPPDVIDQLIRLQLRGRHIDGDVGARTPVQGAPACPLTARLLENPSADVRDHAGALEDGDERIRLHDAPDGMPPPEQCFDPDRLTGTEIEDRLVVEKVLAVGVHDTEVHLE